MKNWFKLFIEAGPLIVFFVINGRGGLPELRNAWSTTKLSEVAQQALFEATGAFMLAKNANKLRARLAFIGPAKITNVFIKGQEMFRVRIGPLSSVEVADRYLKQILDGGITNVQIIVD